MKHLFIPYELAVIAKEKGFNEPCLGFYKEDNENIVINSGNTNSSNESYAVLKQQTPIISAPLYQQIVDWFREKSKIELIILSNTHVSEENNKWEYSIYSLHSKDRLKSELNFHSYYDALNKAIEEAFKLI